uniref:DNA helicase RecQ n=1 Tax=Acetatifactor sp. TaxID=1872090 RepID=UPI004055E79A
MKKEALQVLKKYFGYDSFRTGQDSIIDAVMQGQDSLAIMPTGAGKSICYQVPALMLDGITIVISPLISLMQDQVKALNEAGIHAAYINSSLSESQITKALQYAQQGYYKIIYVAPERLESHDFLQFATCTPISMVTVDEAHCISQWGQDFRPSYLKIVDFIRELPNRPIISAFTATATEEVKTDIICTLGLSHPNIVVTGFDRENLYYRVEYIGQKDEFIVDYIAKHPDESGIIYCATRKNVDKVFELLCEKRVPVTRYHAGLGVEERKQNQDDFIYDRTPIIVATNAFGMGIDKSNVRYVIHYNMPQSMENYYQEAGRAGRDGEPAKCILLFSAQDVMINKFLLDKKDFSDVHSEDIETIRQRDMKRLRSIENYCKTTVCLRNYILDYFGERTIEPCDHCGNCHRVYQEVDMTAQAKWVINCVYETKGRYGISIVVGILRGSNRAKMQEIKAADYKSYGALSDYKRETIRLLINQMLLDEYLCQTNDTYSVLRIGPKMNNLHDEATRIFVRMYEEKKTSEKRARTSKAKQSVDLTSAGFDLFNKLRTLRFEIAREESLPPYIIFNDKSLIDMCVKLPHSREEMLNVSGVGENKFLKYGGRFLDVIAAYEKEHPNAVLSEGVINVDSENTKATKRKRNKKEFYITSQQADEFEYGEMYYISEIKDQLNAVCDYSTVKKVRTTAIWDFLVSLGLVFEENRNGVFIKTTTSKGAESGIEIVHKISKSGHPYELLRYPKFIQKMIVEFFVKEERTDGRFKTF